MPEFWRIRLLPEKLVTHRERLTVQRAQRRMPARRADKLLQTELSGPLSGADGADDLVAALAAEAVILLDFRQARPAAARLRFKGAHLLSAARARASAGATQETRENTHAVTLQPKKLGDRAWLADVDAKDRRPFKSTCASHESRGGEQTP
jgi:hypothetical protein